MQFDWEKTYNNLRLIEIRDFLRRFFNPYNQDYGDSLEGIQQRVTNPLLGRYWRTEDEFLEEKQKREERCKILLQTCLSEGLIHLLDNEYQVQGKPRYALTGMGISLRHSSPKRYSRAAAGKQVATLLERVRSLNAKTPSIEDPATFFYVKIVCSFGSYAQPGKEPVGDVNIFIELASRVSPEVNEAYLNKAVEQNALCNIYSVLPITMAFKYLRKGLTILKLTDTLPPGATTTILYP